MRRPALSISSRVAAAFVALAVAATADAAPSKIGRLAAARAALASGTSRVIVMAATDDGLPDVASAVQHAGGHVRRSLRGVKAHVVDLPNAAIAALADDPAVARISLDRMVVATMERTGATIGATSVRQDLGYDGSGVGVAVIDSGVSSWHDDLAVDGTSQRVDAFVDFVNGRAAPYDDYGHGTHVAGIVAGNGADSEGARSGVAPGARLIALKVLDEHGHGRISDVIAALDYVVANAAALNIRVVNLSVATGVYESYDTDPLTLAAQRVVDAGIVVVAAAGNAGRDVEGHRMYGGITAPGNAPWVLTVGASSHMGTADRSDDTIASFSSRGPTAIDLGAKPDLVAPGVGIESLSDPTSTFYTTQAQALLSGTVPTSYLPYLSQSGTSMAAPVVAGTVALMLQANPALTPNQVKAILQYTAQTYRGYDPLTEGAGFLNARGAVDLAQHFATDPDSPYDAPQEWSRRVIWGNRLLWGGRLTSDANAWATDVTWGASTTADGTAIVLGTAFCYYSQSCTGDSAPWTPTARFRNVVWGARCGGDDCADPWSLGLFGTSDGDTVVWGTNDTGDTVVWGTSDGDTVVWGTSDGDTVVWGTSCSDPSCAPVVWDR